MELFFLLCFLIKSVISFDIPKVGCDADLKINEDHYKVADTYDVGDAYPTDTHYDVYGNLFFVKTGRNSDGYYYDAYVLRFKTDTPLKIPGLPDGQTYSLAIDNNEKQVFFGTGKGMYRYNYETHNSSLVSDISLKLDMIFVDRDSNKYIIENEKGVEELYLLDGSRKIPFRTLEALNEMAIDGKNNFYFIKEEKLFVLKSNLSTPICIGDVTYDGIGQIAFHKENVFIASQDLAYFHENETGNLKLVQNIPGKVVSVAFDHSGDFVLGTRGQLMKYEKEECYFRNNDSIKK